MIFNDRRKKDRSSFFRNVSKKNLPAVKADTPAKLRGLDNNENITKMGKALGWSESYGGVSFKKGNNSISSGPMAGPLQPVARGYSKKNVKAVPAKPKGAQRTYNKVGK